MEATMVRIIGQFTMQTRLYRNALEGIEDGWNRRLNEQVNHLAWIAGHLVSSRYMLCQMTGLEINEPFPEKFAQGKAIEDGDYPSLRKQIEAWGEVSAMLEAHLPELTADELDRDAPFAVPMGKTVGDAIAFFAHHESYHIGQMGLLRKYLLNDAMSYR